MLTSDKEFNPSCSLDLLLKGVALSLQVCRIPIQNVGVFRVDVNVLEEIIPHEGVVALRVLSRKTCGARGYSAETEPEPPSQENARSHWLQGHLGDCPSDCQHVEQAELVCSQPQALSALCCSYIWRGRC